MDNFIYIADDFFFLCIGLLLLYLFILAVASHFKHSNYPKARKQYQCAILVPYGSLLPDVYKRQVQTPISILQKDVLFEGLGKEIPVGRYHSWVVSREGFPECLEITAESQEGQIMALRHKTYDVHGIQFHPESVLTPQGKEIIKNFLNE